MKFLYIKTFADHPKIIYKKETNRPSRGFFIIGIALIVFLTLYVFTKYLQNQYSSLIIISCIMFAIGLIVFGLRIRKMQPEIVKAITEQKTILETRYSFDGSTTFFPISQSSSIILGICVYQIIKSFLGLESVFAQVLIASIVALGAGNLIAIGLTYFYWEYKFKRAILVYRYSQNKK